MRTLQCPPRRSFCQRHIASFTRSTTDLAFCHLETGSRPRFGIKPSRISNGQNPGVKVVREIAPAFFDSAPRSADAKTQKSRHATGCFFYGRRSGRQNLHRRAGHCRSIVISLRRRAGKISHGHRLGKSAIADRFLACRYSSMRACSIIAKISWKNTRSRRRSTWPELVDSQPKPFLAANKIPSSSASPAQFKQYEGLVCNMMEYILEQRRRALGRKAHDQRARSPRGAGTPCASCAITSSAKSPSAACSPTKSRNRSRFSLKDGRFFTATGPMLGRLPTILQAQKSPAGSACRRCRLFPAGTGAAALGGWQLGISRYSRNPDLAWRFVAFMTGLMECKNASPSPPGGHRRARRSTMTMKSPRKIPQFKSLLATFKQAVPRPTTPVYVATVEYHAALFQLGAWRCPTRISTSAPPSPRAT